MKKIVISTILLLFISSSINGQWFPVQPSQEGSYYSIHFVDTLNGWLGGSDSINFILRTTDGGENWETSVLGGNEPYSSGLPTTITFVNKDTGYYIRSFSWWNNHISKTVNGGIDWDIVHTDSVILKSIFFLDKYKGWAVGYKGLHGAALLTTLNGGNYWYRTVFPIDHQFEEICFINESTGIIVGGFPAKIWKTTDGGTNWFLIFESQDINEGRFNSISITDSIWYVAGKNLYISKDSGNSWELRAIPGLDYHSISSSGNKCWALVLNRTTILYSFDYAKTWVPIFRDSHLNGVYFLNSDFGWTYGIGSRLYKTNSGGINNITIPDTPLQLIPENGTNYIYTPVYFEWVDQNYSYFRVQISKDSLLITKEIDTLLIDYKFRGEIDPYTLYYWRIRAENYLGNSDWSPIWNFTTGEVLNVSENEKVVKYKLSQNYPNPFNPTTTIRYEIPERSFVTIIIYDVLGNKVAKLVNEGKPVGIYEVEFHGIGLPSGIYFYRLQAGNYLETKKLVLIK